MILHVHVTTVTSGTDQLRECPPHVIGVLYWFFDFPGTFGGPKLLADWPSFMLKSGKGSGEYHG